MTRIRPDGHTPSFTMTPCPTRLRHWGMTPSAGTHAIPGWRRRTTFSPRIRSADQCWSGTLACRRGHVLRRARRRAVEKLIPLVLGGLIAESREEGRGEECRAGGASNPCCQRQLRRGLEAYWRRPAQSMQCRPPTLPRMCDVNFPSVSIFSLWKPAVEQCSPLLDV